MRIDSICSRMRPGEIYTFIRDATRALVGDKRLQLGFVLLIIAADSAQAQSPWENVATKLMASFTGPIVRGLGTVAVVVGGLEWAFVEGSGKRLLGGLIFGLGMAFLSPSFVAWLFT